MEDAFDNKLYLPDLRAEAATGNLKAMDTELIQSAARSWPATRLALSAQLLRQMRGKVRV